MEEDVGMAKRQDEICSPENRGKGGDASATLARPSPPFTQTLFQNFATWPACLSRTVLPVLGPSSSSSWYSTTQLSTPISRACPHRSGPGRGEDPCPCRRPDGRHDGHRGDHRHDRGPDAEIRDEGANGVVSGNGPALCGESVSLGGAGKGSSARQSAEEAHPWISSDPGSCGAAAQTRRQSGVPESLDGPWLLWHHVLRCSR
mmetsp:Transcript_36792/g.74309  ORF Transcript_36792/g.74309 Transcript_36792/m.74309 type:complete len:203 (-) Transcript_36792:169-777(-)